MRLIIFADDPVMLLSSSVKWSQRSWIVAFQLTTSAFHNMVIPEKFSCDGADVSPSLQWTEPPAGTRGLALIVDDPDAPAGTWVHWVLYDLPVDTSRLAEGMAKDLQLPNGARQGRMILARSATTVLALRAAKRIDTSSSCLLWIQRQTSGLEPPGTILREP